MKFSSVLMSAAAIGMAAVGINAQQNQPACSSIYTRKEILSLTSSEWNLVKSILAAMQRDGWFRWFAYLHNQWFGSIHGNSQFFPFHRRFVYEWERVGKMYNSGYIQPYWDEMRDYRVPASSPVLTSNWVGGNGRSGDRCVVNGVQANWMMTYPNNHCFSRNFGNNGNPSSWYSPETIQNFIQRDTTMTQFRPDIEYTLHGVVHINIGGDMYQGYSPNDWIFMLHHANLDRLWWQWQQNGHLWTMDGPNAGGGSISLDSSMPYFNEPVRSVMQLGYGNMCFQYASNPISRRSLDPDMDQRLAAALPKDVLAEWFPETAKTEIANITDNIVNSVNSAIAEVSEIINSKPFNPIPYPARLTESWIKMHGFDTAEVRKVENQSRKLIDILNKAKYRSPY
ncbi:hypothetical protein J3B02_004569 [Coemansia erecta]|uniref:Tyrosinase copper-binding domain-containing protein n=1 Tax=Coemansia asiatica TaxID=1052880 RepID=A0A9W7XIT0_9FUNG|nr:hypothetical protein LPJ64_002903 [Coemansia asiatica]KAJ2845838.1 hypothetical protein J3B02_004569 [Coemansia erecta]